MDIKEISEHIVLMADFWATPKTDNTTKENL